MPNTKKNEARAGSLVTNPCKTVVAFEGAIPAALGPPIAVLSRLFGDGSPA